MTIVHSALRKWHSQEKKTNSAVSRRFMNVTGVQSMSMLARVHVVEGEGSSSNPAPLLRLELKNARPNSDRNVTLEMGDVTTNTPAIPRSRIATEPERQKWGAGDGVAVAVVDSVTAAQLNHIGFWSPVLRAGEATGLTLTLSAEMHGICNVGPLDYYIGQEVQTQETDTYSRPLAYLVTPVNPEHQQLSLPLIPSALINPMVPQPPPPLQPPPLSGVPGVPAVPAVKAVADAARHDAPQQLQRQLTLAYLERVRAASLVGCAALALDAQVDRQAASQLAS